MRFLLINIVLFFYSSIFAQFSGGDDDGHSFSCYSQQDNSNFLIFSGGNDDGYSFSCYLQQDIPDWMIFSGGNFAGYTSNCFGTLNSEVPLPVELINFNAMPQNRNVVLTWQTVSEINNDYFIIQKSDDAIFFEGIGVVDGAGNSTNVLDYEFIDDFVDMGVFYYRLKQVDFDGKINYSKIKSVSIESTNEVILFPNPTKDYVTVLNLKENNFQLVNVLGEDVLESASVVEYVKGKLILDVRLLKTGVYYLSCSGRVIKFMKQ